MLLYFALAIISIFAYIRIKKYRHLKYENPFSFDWEVSADSQDERPGSFEERDAVLEKEFIWEELPTNKWDVVVVGGGISGLTTAGVLVRAGKRVLVLEQHHRVGGCSSEFYSGGVPFNLGIYYIPPVPIVNNLLSQLTDGKVRWRDLPSPFDEFIWEELPTNKWDVVVVGGGISGLTTAGVLARAGKRVLVLEQHHRVGGCSSEFYSGGVPFNLGIYYIPPVPIVNNLLSQLTDGKVRWRDLPSPFDEVMYRDERNQLQRTHILTYANGSSTTLTDSFPECKKDIETFEALEKITLRKVNSQNQVLLWLKFVPLWSIKFIGWLIKRGWYTDIAESSKITLKMMVMAVTENPQLRRVFAYPMGLFSAATSNVVWSAYCQVAATYKQNGAHLPAGGTAKLLYDIICAIEKRGGFVRMAVDVQRITFDQKGRANGVSVLARNSKCRHEIIAKNVVSSVGVPTTVAILPPEIPTRYRKYSQLSDGSTRRHGVCMICVVVRGSHSALELPLEGIHWFNPTNLDHFGEWLAKDVDQVYEDLANSVDQNIAISVPSANPEFRQRFPDKSACQAIFAANIEWFEDERFLNLADNFAKAMWRQMKDYYPKLTDDKIISLEVFTPKDMEGMLGRRGGATYGSDMSSTKFSDLQQMADLRPQSDIPGLYLAGQDVFGRGLNAASFSGLLVAGFILGQNSKDDLLYAQKQRERDLKRKYVRPPI